MGGQAIMKARACNQPVPAVELLPPGTVLMRCEVPEHAISWKAPTVGRYGAYKSKRLKAWQEIVGIFARLNRRIGHPYTGPVEVRVMARFARGPMGDSTNIIKAIEDALQGIVFVNDRQVIRNSCERILAGFDLVTIEVETMEPIDSGKNQA
jgi:Holliday junction resolvase RusA-like endonuclease